MPHFKKRSVIIQAISVSAIIQGAASGDVPGWVSGAIGDQTLKVSDSNVTIKTLEGVMTGDKDDMIIRGVQGELYPCKPDIFKATYDEVPEEPPLAWQGRVLEEKSDLDKKIEDLGNFMAGDDWGGLSDKTQGLMEDQHNVMFEYSKILSLRISRF